MGKAVGSSGPGLLTESGRMIRSTSPLSVLAAALLLAGCLDRGYGERGCYRDQVCFTDAGQPPDAGEPLDAGSVDAGEPPDAGPCGQPCAQGVGACRAQGVIICEDAGEQCSAVPGAPEDESCDGEDNDCDGVIDDFPNCVHSIAGDGPSGYRDGPGSQARFGLPLMIKEGPDGALYVADALNNAIRRIALDGTVSTFAGGGGCAHVDGPLSIAQLCTPSGLTFHTDGSLYFTEGPALLDAPPLSGNRLRRIRDGGVETVAGGGLYGLIDGPADQAAFAWPRGLHVRSNGDVLVADILNSRIRLFDAASNAVSTFAGTQSGVAGGDRLSMQFFNPSDVVELGTTLYVSEVPRVRLVPHVGASSTLAGAEGHAGIGLVDGVGTDARLWLPGQLTHDADAGVLFVAESGFGRIRGVPLNGVSSTFTEVTASLRVGLVNGPPDVAESGANAGSTRVGDDWYVSDFENHVVRVVRRGPDGGYAFHDLAGVQAGPGRSRDGPAKDALIWRPEGLARAEDGTLYWLEPFAGLLRRLDPAGQVTTLVGHPAADGGFIDGPLAHARFQTARGLALDSAGVLYVADTANHAVRRVDLLEGTVSTLAGAKPSAAGPAVPVANLADARFNDPLRLSVGAEPDGTPTLWVVDYTNKAVRKIILPAGPVHTMASDLQLPVSVAADQTGGAYVVDFADLLHVAGDGVVTPLLTGNVPLPCDVSLDEGVPLLSCYSAIHRLDKDKLQLLFYGGYGWKDGLGAGAGVLDLRFAVPTKDAFWVLDPPNGRIRRIGR
jgi:hypothetical protein